MGLIFGSGAGLRLLARSRVLWLISLLWLVDLPFLSAVQPVVRHREFPQLPSSLTVQSLSLIDAGNSGRSP